MLRHVILSWLVFFTRDIPGTQWIPIRIRENSEFFIISLKIELVSSSLIGYFRFTAVISIYQSNLVSEEF